MAVGFFYVLITLFYSVVPLFEWIGRLNAPRWLDIILHVLALILWLSGMVFMYYAEKAVFKKEER